MQIEVISTGKTPIAEIISDQLVITGVESAVDLLGNVYHQGFDHVIVHEKNIVPAFFDLKTRLAGEILQKFSNYRVRLAIVGNFDVYQSQSLKDFIFESNKVGHIHFARSTAEAVELLSTKK